MNELVVIETARLRQACAQEALHPRSGRLLSPSSKISSPSLKAIRINPENPFEIDFIIDGADTGSVNPEEAARLIKYFLAVLTIPETEVWVNLSPYEADRITTEQLAVTQVGKDLLEQDYMLKQLAASLTYPEDPAGNTFWTRLHQKAYDLLGTTDIPVETFNKVWIVPENAVVYEFDQTAFIAESRLAVMLEQDYLSLKNNNGKEKRAPTPGPEDGKLRTLRDFSSSLTRELLVPVIAMEVNEGETFARLRQIYHSLILAVWFKKKMRDHIVNRIYSDRKKVGGIEIDDKRMKEEIYKRYLTAFRKGVYNYIREDYDSATESMIPRKYFSGGFSVDDPSRWLNSRPISRVMVSSTEFLRRVGKSLSVARVRLDPLGVKSESLVAMSGPMSPFKKAGLSLFLAASLMAIPGVMQGSDGGPPDLPPSRDQGFAAGGADKRRG